MGKQSGLRTGTGGHRGSPRTHPAHFPQTSPLSGGVGSWWRLEIRIIRNQLDNISIDDNKHLLSTRFFPDTELTALQITFPFNFLSNLLAKSFLSAIYRCVNWDKSDGESPQSHPALGLPRGISNPWESDSRAPAHLPGWGGGRSVFCTSWTLIPSSPPRPGSPLWFSLVLCSLPPVWKICGNCMMYELPFVKILFSVKHDVFPPDLQVGFINLHIPYLCYISCRWFIKRACKSSRKVLIQKSLF